MASKSSLSADAPRLKVNGRLFDSNEGLGICTEPKAIRRSRNASTTRRRHATRVSTLNLAEDRRDADEVEKYDVTVRKSSKYTSSQITNMRNSLKSLFYTPCKKWQERRQFPFKLVLQLLKVVVVTWQLVTFAGERSTFEKFSQTNRISFHHVFLKGWDSGQEVLPYPPGGGVYAMYSQAELSEHLNFAVSQYFIFDDVTLSTLEANETVWLNINYFKRADLNPLQQSFSVNSYKNDNPDRIELPRSLFNCTDNKTDPESCVDVIQYLEDTGQRLDLERLIDMSLEMSLRGINVKQPEFTLNQPVADVDCVDFNIQIKYDNSRGNGQIPVKLTTQLDMRVCNGTNDYTNPVLERRNVAAIVGLTTFDGVVIVMCLTSFILAARSIVRRTKKMMEAQKLFKEHYGYSLTRSEIMDFITVWYFQYVISDTLVIIGTLLKIYVRHGHVSYTVTFNNEQYYNAAGVMLGLANWSQWIGLIRYLGFFSRYYTLILTITNAIPALVRFLVTCTTIFLGYLFAGWIILGPYNQKFDSVATTSQSLFSLINGDEIYATMSIINVNDHPTVIWLISWLYLYSYIILFVFAIANLFIAIINDSYETIKNGEGNEQTFLNHFVDDTLNVVPDLEPEEDDTITCGSLLCCFPCCSHKKSRSKKYDDGDLRRPVSNLPSNGMEMSQLSTDDDHAAK